MSLKYDLILDEDLSETIMKHQQLSNPLTCLDPPRLVSGYSNCGPWLEQQALITLEWAISSWLVYPSEAPAESHNPSMRLDHFNGTETQTENYPKC